MSRNKSHPLRERACELRQNQTDAEQMLWRLLRSRQISAQKFRRQYPIGPFVVDFCCFEKKLVIELDGGQHDENTDAVERRSACLREQGYRIMRFWNNEFMENSEAVLDEIARVLEMPSL